MVCLTKRPSAVNVMSVPADVAAMSAQSDVSASEQAAEGNHETILVPDDPYGDDDDDKRLWIGNLDTRMTEFALLKLVQKFGTIRKLDCIYHKAGPDKGKSKGYCFVSFHTWEAAEKARKSLDGKHVLSRPMYVKWARGSKQFPSKINGKVKVSDMTPAPSLPPVAAAALSLSATLATADTETKIEAIEAKLRLMEQTQTDFSIDTVLKPIPGLRPPIPAATSSKPNTHSSRHAPYRRTNGTGHPHRWKK